MSLSQVRTYLQNRIGEVDSDFREHDDAFNAENIPGVTWEKAYHIRYLPLISNATNDQKVQDNFPVTVQLFFNGYTETRDRLDTAMDLAHNVRLKTISPSKVYAEINISQVVCNNIIPDAIPTNDNKFIIELQFNFRLIFYNNQ